MPATSEPLTSTHAIKSVMDWWALAGVDMAVADSPRGWLGEQKQGLVAPAQPDNDAPAVLAATLAATPPAMPDTLPAFIDWLANAADLPEARFPGDRILPRTVVGARLLVITDVPTDEDMAAGRLLSGADGKLLGAMLTAIGLGEAEVSVASLLLTRPAGGMGDARIWAGAAARMRQYIALTAPGGLLVFGDQASRALGETDSAGNVELSGNINHMDLMNRAMRFPAPYILMRYPARKAAVWAELRKLAAMS